MNRKAESVKNKSDLIETSNEKEAFDFIDTMNLPIVVKADGL